MKLHHVLLLGTSFLAFGLIFGAQVDPKLENANAAVVGAFETHDIVMFGEIHGNKQEYAWLRSLVATPEFADRVDDIVMETGNSLYQKSVDRYVSGEDVPLEQVQKAWRNTVGVIGPPSPVSVSLYQAVREANLKRRGKHQMRILCGDPYIDWERVKDREDIAPYLGNRDQWYTQVVKDEVLAKHHRALLIMGWGHFLRSSLFPGGQRYSIERELRAAGPKTYLIVFGTNTPGDYDDLDYRFDSWPAPVIVSLCQPDHKSICVTGAEHVCLADGAGQAWPIGVVLGQPVKQIAGDRSVGCSCVEQEAVRLAADFDVDSWKPCFLLEG